MGKAEGHGENWHGHVTALTVSPDYRRLGLAATLMNILEDVSEKWVTYLLCNTCTEQNLLYYKYTIKIFCKES